MCVGRHLLAITGYRGDGAIGSLAKDLAAIPEKALGVKDVLGLLDPDDRKALEEALANPKLTAPAITKALHAHGYKVSASAVAKYRAS